MTSKWYDIEIKQPDGWLSGKKKYKIKPVENGTRRRETKFENGNDNEMSPTAGFTHNLQLRHETAQL